MKLLKEMRKKSHDALEEAKRAEEDVERARLIGMHFLTHFVSFSASTLTDTCVSM
jgi:hypothetical protein